MKLSKNIERGRLPDGSYNISGACRFARLLSSLSNEHVVEYAHEVIPSKYHDRLSFIFNMRKQLMIWFYGKDILLFDQFDNLARTKE
jgi:hypothetical protein